MAIPEHIKQMREREKREVMLAAWTLKYIQALEKVVRQARLLCPDKRSSELDAVLRELAVVERQRPC